MVKNNRPLNSPLYDDFRISDIKTSETVFTVQIDNFREEEIYTIYGKVNDFAKQLFATDFVKSFVNWINKDFVT